MLRLLLLLSFTSGGFAQSVFTKHVDTDERVLINVGKHSEILHFRIPHVLLMDVTTLDDPETVRGSKLLPVSELHTKLMQFGLNSQQKFLIVGGSTSGWGEEGRLLWILEQFFKVDAKILDGGVDALIDSLSKGTKIKFSESIRGPLELKTQDQMEQYGVLINDLNAHTQEIVDVRGVLEFSGFTPFGSKIGGHIPGAKSVPWDQFFDGEGFLREKPLFMKSLSGKQLVVYCTAGYRSAMVWAVLRHFGIKSLNYDGSWFEYSEHGSKKTNN